MEKMQKKKRRQLFGWLCLAAAVILLTAMPLIAGQKTAQEGPVATVISGTADTGTITVTLGGGGTLSEETSEKITLPDGIKIKEFLVKNGDSVQQGDPLAAVDPVSVMAAIAEIQETMDYLTTQIASAGESKGTTRLTAMTAGRVKEVYAQSGDDVQSVMLEHGALALLSLDGRMAVDIEKHTELSAGDAVEVAFPEGKSVAGRVESSLDGMLTVSLADKDYVIGQQVTGRTPEGDTLGTGSLYVHNAWKVTAYFGKVAKVNIKVNDKVTKGRLLFQLEETGHSTQAQVLNAERQEYEILMEKLFGIYETGLLTAPCDGIVGGVRTDSPWMLSAMETDLQKNLLENGTTGNGGWTVILLSAQMPEEKPEGGE